MVSTDSSVGDTLSTRKAVAKPIVVDYYNQHMSGCDRADQLVGYYGHQTRRSTKWWKKLFYWAMEIAMMNAYIMFKDTRPRPFTKWSQKTFSFLNYKKRLIKQLESKAVDLTDMAAVGIEGACDAIRSPVGRPKKMRKIVSPIEIATPGQHLVGKSDPESFRRCENSSTPKAPKRTFFICKTCPTKLHLHPGTFFTSFHRS